MPHTASCNGIQLGVQLKVMFAADCLAPCLHGREAKQHAAAAATGHATRCTALGKVMRPREVHHVASASFVLLRHALDGRSFSQNHTGIVQHLVNQGKLEACEHQHGSSSIPLLLLKLTKKSRQLTQF